MNTSPKSALTVLNRLAARRTEQTSLLDRALNGRLDALALVAIEVAVESGDPIGTVLARLLAGRAYDDLFDQLEKAIPKETIALRELRLVAVRKRFESKVYQKEFGSVSEVLQASLILSEYSNALSELGKLTEARNASAFALHLMQQVPTQGNPELTAGLAALWHSLSFVEAELGNLDGAEPCAEMALALYGEALQLGSPSIGMLADAESNLATILLTREKFEEARTLLEDGVQRLERIGDASSLQDRFYYARVNNNLAIVLGKLDDLAEARAAAELAAVTIRHLSEEMPDAYRGFLARYLITRGSISLQIGEHQDAIEDLNEAVLLLKELNLQRPDAFTDDYLLATATLATVDEDRQLADNIESAVNRAMEEPERWRRWWIYAAKRRVSGLGQNWGEIAVELRRTLEKVHELDKPLENRQSEVEVLDEAKLAFVQAIALRRTGDSQGALRLITDTLRRIETLHSKEASLWRARTKSIRGGLLFDAGDTDEALDEQLDSVATLVDVKIFDEAAKALQIASSMVRASSDLALHNRFLKCTQTAYQGASFGFMLALSAERVLLMATDASSNRAIEGSISQTAANAAQASSAVCNEASLGPDSRKDLHHRLKEAADLLQTKSLFPDAVELLLDAAQSVLGSKAHFDPELREVLFQSMMDDARYFIAESKVEKAIRIFEEGVRRQRESLVDRLDEPPIGLASFLDQWSMVLHKQGREEQAVRIAEDAIEAYERAFQLQPAGFWLDYAGGLNNLANRYWKVGQKDQSLVALERGLALFEVHPGQRDQRAMLIGGTLMGSYLERATEVGRSATDMLRRYVQRGRAPQSQ